MLVDHDRTQQIYSLVPSSVAKAHDIFPRKLSESGLFQSVRNAQPAPGVLPYEINSELWSDGAIAERLVAIPGGGRIRVNEQGIWQFPEGSVLARTISLEPEQGKPASRRRVETQILHRESEAWRPYSYLWNDKQDDADLVGALGATLTIKDGKPGTDHERTYRVHARSECILCHNPWVEKKTTIFGVQSASPLGINTLQTNKPLARAGPGANQLKVFHEAGILSWTPVVARLPRLVDPYDESANLDQRARSYLQTNCATLPSVQRRRHGEHSAGLRKSGTARPKPWEFGRFREPSELPGRGSSRPVIRAGRCFSIACRSSGVVECPELGQARLTSTTRMIYNWIARLPNSAGPPDETALFAKEDLDAFASLRKLNQISPEERAAAAGRFAQTTQALAAARFDRPRAGFVAITKRRRGDSANEPDRGSPRPFRAVYSAA